MSNLLRNISRLVVLVILVSSTVVHAQDNREQRVYSYHVAPAEGSVDGIANTIDSTVSSHGIAVLSNHSVGVPSECSFSARVLSLFDPDYADQLFQLNAETAPYAIVARVNIFNDENGRWISAVNERSILRTAMLDDPGAESLAEHWNTRIRGFLTEVVNGDELADQYG